MNLFASIVAFTGERKWVEFRVKTVIVKLLINKYKFYTFLVLFSTG